MSDDGIEFEVGDVFKTPNGPIKVVSNGYDLMVTDPTITHPQDARAGNWQIDRELLKNDLADPDCGVERASLEVV